MRLAWRLAQREVRRRKGRTLMVVLLVAVTVAGITVADLAYRSHNLRNASDFGAADLRLTANASFAGPAGFPTLDDVLASLPAGASTVTGEETYSLPVQRADKPGLAGPANLTTLDLTVPMLRGATIVRAGRLPAAQDEVALGSDVATRLQVGVGDRLQLAHPDVAFTVVGIADRAGGDASLFAAPGYPTELLVPGAASRVVYVAGVPTGWFPFNEANAYVGVEYPPTTREPAPEEILIVWLAMTLLLGVLGIVIAAAFAASGRRQLVTLGQLGATGADQRFARRFLALQGLVTSVVGAVVGVGVGAAVAAAVGDPVLRRGEWDVRLLDLSLIVGTTVVVGTLAALLPTRALAKAPVLTALAGRAPVRQVPRWQVPLGVVAILGGLGVLGLSVSSVADGAGDAIAIMLAMVSAGAVLGGVCALSPVVVDHWRWIGGRRAGTVRLAVRSMVRHRARSAALVAAIAAVGAAGVAGASGIERWSQLDRLDRAFGVTRLDVVTISPDVSFLNDTGTIDDPGAAGTERRRAEVDAIVSGIEWSSASMVADRLRQTTIFVADDATLRALGVPESQWAAFQAPGPGIRIAVRHHEVDNEFETEVPTLTVGLAQVVDESTVAASPAEWQRLSPTLIGVAPTDLTDAQRQQIANTSFADQYASWFTDVVPAEQAIVNVEYKPSSRLHISRTSARWLVIVALLLLVTVIVAIGLALWAAEGKVERDQLVAVGAPPSALARMAGARAWIISTTGGLIAVPLGWVMLGTILNAADKSSPFPTLTALMVALAIPLVVAGGAVVASRVAQAAHPVIGSSMSLD
ncbi:MAG: FtsX-like permease family protein [Ilumatobacteraceae bacterium]